ncbi:MAG: phosphoribosylglycinamide formyltransferase [Bacteroidota bacterium]
MSRIAIFASGSGTNAENLIKYFNENSESPHRVVLVLTNNANARVLNRSKALNVETSTFSREEFYNSDKVLNLLHEKNCDFIVLAGFLWLVPPKLIKEFPNRIVNIHPALLPKYGGKGMYGMRVHEAVIEAGEKESGITIHWVNEAYDEGNTIFQATCPVDYKETPQSLAEKIHTLEYNHFPKIVEKIIDELS